MEFYCTINTRCNNIACVVLCVWLCRLEFHFASRNYDIITVKLKRTTRYILIYIYIYIYIVIACFTKLIKWSYGSTITENRNNFQCTKFNGFECIIWCIYLFWISRHLKNLKVSFGFFFNWITKKQMDKNLKSKWHNIIYNFINP